MQAVDLLLSRYREIEKLLSRFEKTTKKRHKEMLLAALADDLTTQMEIKEHQFYPALRGVGRIADLILESIHEHLGIKRILADLRRVDADDESFMTKIKVLKEAVTRHVKKEETELFPKAKGILDPEEMQILGGSLEAEQHRIERRPRHTRDYRPTPSAPKSPLKPSSTLLRASLTVKVQRIGLPALSARARPAAS